jgi:hypothetical protein
MSNSSLARKNLNNQAPRQTFREERKAKMEVVPYPATPPTQENIAERIANARRMTENFVKSLIRENATYENGGLSLFVSSLSRIEKKLFLSYVVEPSEYEWLCENDVRLYAAFDEYEKDMQGLIDKYLDESWHEAMQERGLVMGKHNDNGEVYYYKR